MEINAAEARPTPGQAPHLLSPSREISTVAGATRLPLAAQPHTRENNLLGRGGKRDSSPFAATTQQRQQHHLFNPTCNLLKAHGQNIEHNR